MSPPPSGGQDDVRKSPVGDQLDRARKEATAWTEVRKDVEHLGDKVDGLSEAVKALAIQEHKCGKEGDLRMHEGRLDAQDGRINNVDKRLDWLRGAAMMVVLAFVGTLTTVLVTCNEQNEQAATTKTMVQNNSVNISKLEKAIERVNEGREEDVQSIVRAVENLQQESEKQSADEWWKNLPSRDKSAIIRAVGKHAIPTTE